MFVCWPAARLYAYSMSIFIVVIILCMSVCPNGQMAVLDIHLKQRVGWMPEM
jgi:hypothetical protein